VRHIHGCSQPAATMHGRLDVRNADNFHTTGLDPGILKGGEGVKKKKHT